MTAPRTYSTARAFRVSLETRLKQIAKDEGIDLLRLRRQVAFDRLLARLFSSRTMPWVLKGGYALELRFQQARTTKDIDLTIENPKNLIREYESMNVRVREELQEQVAFDLGDRFIFLIGEPMMDINAAPYGGARYPIDARMAGRTFAKFHLDVGVGDIVMAPVEILKARDWLKFAGIAPPALYLQSKEQQFAEKLHAYTLPDRKMPNSRVKDLVDMLILIERGDLDLIRVADSIKATFRKRKTHQVPNSLAPPPERWRPVFRRLSVECSLDTSMDAAFNQLSGFVEEL